MDSNVKDEIMKIVVRDEDGKESIIEVKKPNRFHLEEFFRVSPRNLMQANRNLLINIAVEPDNAREMLDIDPVLAMSIAGPLAELIGLKESFLVKSALVK